MSDFTISDPPPVKVTGKKRKNEETSEDVRELAKSYCTTPDEWATASKLPPSKLAKWVEEKEFERTVSLRKSVFDGLHTAYGFVLDKLTRGDGYVQEQIQADVTLRDSIEQEMTPLFKFLNNRAKILFLSGTNIVQAKLTQRRENPQIEEILSGPEINNGRDNETDILLAESGSLDDHPADEIAREEEGRDGEEVPCFD